MKKLLLILAIVVALVILGGGGATVWYLRGMGPSDSAKLAPASTVAFFSLPDLPRSAYRWPQTALGQIGAEKEVRAFLERPLNYLARQQGGNEAVEMLWKVKPARLFVAISSIAGEEPAAVIGFQFWGGKAAHDVAVARLRQELRRHGPAAEVTRESHEGDEITISSHGPVKVFAASHGQWGFLSTSGSAIRDALDRAAGRAKSPSLAEDEQFGKAVSRVSTEPDALFYMHPGPILDLLLAVGQSYGAQAIPSQVEQLRKVEAISGSFKFDGANLRDTLFILRPNPPGAGEITRAPLQFTSPRTLAFLDFVTDFHGLADALTGTALFAKNPAFKDSRLSSLIPEAFGPECGLGVTWEPGQFKPDAVLAVQVADPAKAAEAMAAMVTLFPEATVTEDSGLKLTNFPALASLAGNPTFAITGDFLLVALDGSEIIRAVNASKARESLASAPGFIQSALEFRASNELLGYIDSRGIFEQAYPFVRQLVTVGTAMMPGASDIIDSSKIPQTEAIARRLDPITFTQSRRPDGYLLESKGPITFDQALLIGGIIGGQIMKPAGSQPNSSP